MVRETTTADSNCALIAKMAKAGAPRLGRLARPPTPKYHGVIAKPKFNFHQNLEKASEYL